MKKTYKNIITINTCDICGSINKVEPMLVDIIKIYESPEGVQSKPHKMIENLDICQECYKKIKDKIPLYVYDCYGQLNFCFEKPDLIDKLTKEHYYEGI